MDIAAIAKAHNQKAARQNWNQFCDPTLTFSQPRYDQLVAVWREKSAGRKMPRRSDLTPRDLKDYLRDLLLCNRISVNPSRYMWRLIGSTVAEILGNYTGKTFEESIPPQQLERWIESSDMILSSEIPWRMRGRVHVGGRDYLDAENLYLPLADDNDKPAFILGLCRYTPHVSESAISWENELASIPGAIL